MEDIKLRKATIDDCDLIFNWANDKDERRNSFNQDPIPYEDHCNWYKGKMSAADAVIFILEVGETSIGQCRLDFEGEAALISYHIDKNYRGKGYGKKIILSVLEAVRNDYPLVKTLMAQVKLNNIPSQKVFLSLGFSETDYSDKAYKEYRLLV